MITDNARVGVDRRDISLSIVRVTPLSVSITRDMILNPVVGLLITVIVLVTGRSFVKVLYSWLPTWPPELIIIVSRIIKPAEGCYKLFYE